MKELIALVKLIRQRNKVDKSISAIIGCPALVGNIGEFIASKIFDIDLRESRSYGGNDGTFKAGNVADSTVNVKLYLKNEHVLDIALKNVPDYYLVLAGPTGREHDKHSRPITLTSVYLFKADASVVSLRHRQIGIGQATSVAKKYWDEAEIYPRQACQFYIVSDNQKKRLRLFKG